MTVMPGVEQKFIKMGGLVGFRGGEPGLRRRPTFTHLGEEHWGRGRKGENALRQG